jgi:hypothetical protein
MGSNLLFHRSRDLTPFLDLTRDLISLLDSRSVVIGIRVEQGRKMKKRRVLHYSTQREREREKRIERMVQGNLNLRSICE